MVACEIAWLCMLLEDLGQHINKKVVLNCDNLNSTQLVCNMFHVRKKHIEFHNQFIIERVLTSDIDLLYANTKEQVADIFTKALGVEKLCRFQSILGIKR